MAKKLFAVYLGGSAPRANTELHDVVFVTGSSIEDCYTRLLDKWFGNPEGLHLDSWVELSIIDRHRVSVGPEKPANGKKLYFVNLGAYRPGQFMEYHANGFFVAATALEAKGRAKKELLPDWGSPVHTDDLHDIDDCLEVSELDGDHIRLEETEEKTVFEPKNGYHLVPKAIVEEYVKKRTVKA